MKLLELLPICHHGCSWALMSTGCKGHSLVSPVILLEEGGDRQGALLGSCIQSKFSIVMSILGKKKKPNISNCHLATRWLPCGHILEQRTDTRVIPNPRLHSGSARCDYFLFGFVCVSKTWEPHPGPRTNVTHRDTQLCAKCRAACVLILFLHFLGKRGWGALFEGHTFQWRPQQYIPNNAELIWTKGIPGTAAKCCYCPLVFADSEGTGWGFRFLSSQEKLLVIWQAGCHFCVILVNWSELKSEKVRKGGNSSLLACKITRETHLNK